MAGLAAGRGVRGAACAERCPGTPTGRNGSTHDAGPERALARGNAGATDARCLLDAELQRYQLDASKLALVGFSQGTMMALHVGLRRRVAPAAIVGFSGVLVGPEHLGEAQARTPKANARRSFSCMATKIR